MLARQGSHSAFVGFWGPHGCHVRTIGWTATPEVRRGGTGGNVPRSTILPPSATRGEPVRSATRYPETRRPSVTGASQRNNRDCRQGYIPRGDKGQGAFIKSP